MTKGNRTVNGKLRQNSQYSETGSKKKETKIRIFPKEMEF